MQLWRQDVLSVRLDLILICPIKYNSDIMCNYEACLELQSEIVADSKAETVIKLSPLCSVPGSN